MLVVHDALEREFFYPACERRMGKTDLLGESLVEHGVIEFGLLRADLARDEDAFEHFMTVLEENFDHHVDEEEDQLLPNASKMLGQDELDDLGARMEDRMAELLEEDWRAHLHANVRQVLAGALETKPKKAAAAKKKVAKARGRQPTRGRQPARTAPAARGAKKARGAKAARSAKTTRAKKARGAGVRGQRAPRRA